MGNPLAERPFDQAQAIRNESQKLVADLTALVPFCSTQAIAEKCANVVEQMRQDLATVAAKFRQRGDQVTGDDADVT